MSLPNDKSKSILSQWKNLQKGQTISARQRDERPKEHIPSMGQKRLYFLDQLFPSNPVYNLTEIWDFQGPLDIQIFLKAIEAVGEKHDVLRTTFQLDQENIKCKISDVFKFNHEIIDFTNSNENSLEQDLNILANKKSRISFDLDGGPLLAFWICKLTDQSFRVIVNMHHIISDKWSMRIFRAELSSAYVSLKSNAKMELPPLTHQYADYVLDEQSRQANTKSNLYWKSKLENANQNVTLPYDKDSYKNESLSGKYSTIVFPKDLFPKIRSFCKDHKMTSFTFFLSIFKILIHKYSGENDMVVGTPISTRSKTEFESIIGFFNDTIALRSILNPESTFLEFLSNTRDGVFEAFEHKDIGFHNVINQVNPNRSISVNPLFQLMFLYHHELQEKEFSEELSLKVQNFDMGVSKFDLTLYVSESSNQFELTIEYATDLFSAAYVQRIHDHIVQLSQQVILAPSTPIKKLNCLSDTETQELFRIGTGPNMRYSDKGIIASIFNDVDYSSIAIVDETKSISYKQLDLQSNRIANQLLSSKVKSSTVAILMEQSVDFVVAMIGVLKAGLSYIPLDASYPQNHIQYILEESESTVILSNRQLTKSQYNGYEIIHFEDVNASDQSVLSEWQTNTPAYTIFTSGSTGKPNGVVISHGNLLNSTKARFEFYVDHPSSFLLLSSFSFDSSVAGIYWTLMNGGKLVIPNLDTLKDVDKISSIIKKEEVSHTLLIPSLYKVYLEYIPTEILGNLKVVALAGEVLSPAIAKEHNGKVPNTRLYNEYGPTEATVWTSAHEVEFPLQTTNIPIGKPIANTKLAVLNSDLQLLPKGIEGELYILGPSVSSGYLKPQESEKRKFISTELFGAEQTLYRTGDWVKWDDGNNLIFVGRKDHQIKIRGHRIELGEINAAIESFDNGIQANTIFVKERNELVSFVQSKAAVEKVDLSQYLKSFLPKHFCPDKIIQIEKFPLMPNGKLDNKELQNLAKQTKVISQNGESLTPFLNKVLIVWREILQNSELTVDDNFFESGGDSIQIIRVVSRLRKEGINISPKDIYERQSVKSLAEKLDVETVNQAEVFIWDKLPLLPIQEWFFETHLHNPNHWLQGYSFEFVNAFSFDEVKMAIHNLSKHHPVFNLNFAFEYGQWFHFKRKFNADDFIIVDEEKRLDFDLIDIQKGPLIRFILNVEDGLIRNGSVIAHHLIIDALSWSILINDLEYELTEHRSNKTIQRFDFLRWTYELNLLASTNRYDGSLTYWENAVSKKSKYFSKFLKSKECDTQTIHKTLDKETTKALKNTARRFSNLNVDEIIIASFLKVFHYHTSESDLTIMLERHGRDVDAVGIDLVNSIGWHTAYFPVHFQLSNPTSIKGILLAVKEQVRSIPDNGQSYGVHRYLSNSIIDDPDAKVVINYLGEHMPTASKIFSSLDFLREGIRADNSERDYLIELNAWIEDGALKLAYSFDRHQLNASDMELWCSDLSETISGISENLAIENSIRTPSDFDFNYNKSDLDAIFSSEVGADNIKDIVDLNATQSALLFHHLQSPKTDQGLIVAKANLNGEIDIDDLQIAWNTLVERHDVLRSFFIWDSVSKPAQIICKCVESKIEFINYELDSFQVSHEELNSWIEDYSNVGLKLSSPSIYKLASFKLSNNLHRLVFVCHHIYIDGWSTSNLFYELIEVYNIINQDQLPNLDAVPKLATWKKYFNRLRDNPNTSQFWISYLADVKPSLLKKTRILSSNTFRILNVQLDERNTSILLEQLKKSRLTLNVLFIGIWSWLLSKYLDQDEVVFGLTHSGRALSLDNMDSLIGMFSSVLPIRTNRRVDDKIDFNEVQTEFNEILERDAISLEDLSLKLPNVQSNLYDTLLIVENFMVAENSANGVFLSDFGSRVSSMMPFCLIVIPGDQLKFTLRYNDQLYDLQEVQNIASDIEQILIGIQLKHGASEMLFSPKYVVENKPEQIQLESNLFSGVAIDKPNDLQDDLLSIWKAVFRNENIQQDDNFFEIGGTSILAVQIFNRINKELNINASPILLLKNNTVRSLGTVFARGEVENSWQCLYPLSENGNLPPLFCFHAGDGHIMFFKDLANAINQDRNVYGIQPVGLDGSDVQFMSIVEMADFYIQEIKKKYPNGPYHLMGTCFSNSVTFEIAKKLKSEIGSMIIVDSPPPYFKELSKLSKWMNWVITLNFSKLSEAFSNYFKYSKLREPSDVQEKNQFNTAKHLRNILSQYKWESQNIEITLIRSAENDEDQYKLYHILNWKLLAKKGLLIKTIEGSHQDIFQGDSAINMAKLVDEILSHYDS